MKLNFLLNIAQVGEKFILRLLLFLFIAAILPLTKLSFSESYNYTGLLIRYFLFLLILFESNRLIIVKLKKKFPRNVHIFKHLLFQLPLTLLNSFIVIVLMQLIWNKFQINVILPKISNFVLLSLIISVSIVTIYEGADFFSRWKEYIIRSERIEKENLIAKYEALKEQIHPHFLFNGLNTLIGLIESNDKKAATYATNLSEFLKYLLTYQNKKLISVKEEMDVVNQYTYIQHVRFKDNLIVNIDIDKKCIDKKIPPLAIQMLVENAIKHNAISKKQKLEISIKNIDLEWIEIKNNKQAKAFANSAQVGLKNINNRYSFVSHKQIEVNDVNNEFSVKLPLL